MRTALLVLGGGAAVLVGAALLARRQNDPVLSGIPLCAYKPCSRPVRPEDAAAGFGVPGAHTSIHGKGGGPDGTWNCVVLHMQAAMGGAQV